MNEGRVSWCHYIRTNVTFEIAQIIENEIDESYYETLRKGY